MLVYFAIGLSFFCVLCGILAFYSEESSTLLYVISAGLGLYASILHLINGNFINAFVFIIVFIISVLTIFKK